MSAFSESKLDTELVSKAVNALLKFEAKKATEGSNGKALLVSNYAKPVLVQIQLFNDVTRAVTKPTRVKIPHSLFSLEEEDNTICLFCRSDDKESITQYLEENPIEGLTKVISINEAKKHYVQFKDKKALLTAHSHFICDSRIVGQLYNILGSTFSSRNDHPVQINYTTPKQLPELVKKVISSSYFRLAGKNISIRLGHTGMKSSAVIENILEGLPFAIEKLQNAWKDVHSIHLKTSDSASLPIYSKIPNEMQQYVSQKATTTTSSTAVTPAGKGKKSVVVAEEKVVVKSSTPAAKPSTAAAVTSTKKRKIAEEEAVPAATTPGVKSAKKATKTSTTAMEVEEAPVVAPKSARKTPAKKAAAAVEEEVEEAPVVAPKSARKTPAKKAAAVEEEVEEAPAAAPKSARKTPAKKAAAAVEEEVEEAPAAAPKSARKTPAKKAAAAETTTPAARTQPRRAASARK